MGLRQVSGVSCSRCGKRYGERATGCADCGELGLLEIAYDLDDVARSLDRPALERREPWMWRFKELLPLDELAETPSLQVGMTPVHGAPRLASWIGVAGLWLKDEGRSPSGSVEDRASALAVAQAREAGRKVVAAAGGPAVATSLACLTASTGQRAVIFAAEGESRDELGLAARFGATVLAVDGGPREARELCAQACGKENWFDRTPGASPWTFEGKKTAGHEIAEQLGEKMPDWVALADDEQGELVAAVARGLAEMRALKIAPSTPRLLRVRHSGVPVGEEAGWERAKELVRKSQGETVSASDDEAAQAGLEAARRGAVEIDAASAAALAGLKKAVAEDILEEGQTALVLLSGRPRATAAPARPIPVGRELARVEQAMASQ